MFNKTYIRGGNTSQSININAVTGAILKNHPKSWFEKFNLNGERARQLLTEGGHKGTKKEYRDGDKSWNYTTYNVPNPDKNITILQMVICGDMEVMAELVYTKDYMVQAKEGADNG